MSQLHKAEKARQDAGFSSEFVSAAHRCLEEPGLGVTP